MIRPQTSALTKGGGSPVPDRLRVTGKNGRFRPVSRPRLAARRGEGYHLGLSGDGNGTVPETRKERLMAKGKKRLEVIHLVCSETGDQNYTLRRKSGGEKLKVKKYSPRLRKHTLHNEKKK